MKEKKTKIASSGTKEGLEKLINEYFFSTTCNVGADMNVYNKHGIINGAFVELKKGKLIFYINE